MIARRTGWFDAVAMRRAIMTNGITSLCVTKLDVMDGLADVRICVDYGSDGRPVYETMPGWSGTTAGLRSLAAMPAEARSYLACLESACGVPVTIVSTGPDREQTIISTNPFD
jgi:adenylosuccinate synthase